MGARLAGGLGLAALLALSGCPAPGPTVPTGGAVTLHIMNNSSAELAYLYVAPAGSEAWGEDVLGVDNTIPPGTEFSVQVVPGTYDLKVDDFAHTEISRRSDVVLTEDSQWILYDE